MLGPPNLGVRGKFLVVIHFFQVPYHFSMIFIKNFQNSMIFPGFPGVLSFSQVEWEPRYHWVIISLYYLITNLNGVGEERGHTMFKLGWKGQFLDGRFFSERLLDGTSAQILEWRNHFCDPQCVDVTSHGHEQAAIVVPPG